GSHSGLGRAVERDDRRPGAEDRPPTATLRRSHAARRSGDCNAGVTGVQRRQTMSAQMKEFLGTSYLFGGNAPFIEELYESWLQDPESVAPEWRRWFDQIQQPGTGAGAGEPIREAFVRLAYKRPGGNGHAPTVAVA